MTLLAGRVGQLVNNSAIASEVGVSSTTIDSWMSILEAVKAIQNTGGSAKRLYFYRNTNGVEVDLVHETQGKLNLYEIKSS